MLGSQGRLIVRFYAHTHLYLNTAALSMSSMSELSGLSLQGED